MPKYKWFYSHFNGGDVEDGESACMEDLAKCISYKDAKTNSYWINDIYMKEEELPDIDENWKRIQVKVTPIDFKIEVLGEISNDVLPF